MNTNPQIIQAMNIGEGVPYPCRVLVEEWPDRPAVYLLVDPRTDEVFYVGATRNFRNRMATHCKVYTGPRETRPTPAEPLELRKLDIAADGFPLVCRIAAYCADQDELDATEKMFIWLHRDTALNTMNRLWEPQDDAVEEFSELLFAVA